MNAIQFTMLITSVVSMGLVVFVFGFFAPWYRTIAGSILFFDTVSTFLILLLLALNESGSAPAFARWLSVFTFPFATLSFIAMLVLMTLTQLSHFSEAAARLLFQKHPARPEWDGVERRHESTTEEETK